MKKITEDVIDTALRIFRNIIKQVIDFSFNANADTIDKEKVAFFEKIAEYGWTYYWEIYNAYDRIRIENQEDADACFYPLLIECDFDTIESMVDVLLLYPKLQKELLEALKCYKSEEYRGCAMIVTSLLEKIFIMIQKEYKPDIQNIRTGRGAIKNINKLIDKDYFRIIGEECYLSSNSIMKFLEVFFSPTNNFENDMSFINRNMLMHGMWTNDIRRIDCMKLFLALFNEVTEISMYFDTKDIF